MSSLQVQNFIPALSPAISGTAFNVVALAFLQPLDATTFPASVTTTTTGDRLPALTAAGAGWVRLAFDPTGWLGAANGTIETQQIADITGAIDVLRAKGLNVLVDAHVNDFTGAYTVATIAADYLLWAANHATGPTYQRYRLFMAALAAALTAYRPDKAAIHIWNESDTGALTNAQWAALNLDLQGVVRSANQSIATFVSGNAYSNVDGLTAMNPYGFDAKTVFCFTPYIPQLVTHQGLGDGSDPGFVGGSTTPAFWPPIPSDNAALKTAMHTAVDASTNATKTATKARIDGYIDTLTLTGVDGHAFDQTWLSAELATLVTWASTNSIPMSRICMTEFGMHRRNMGGGDLGPAPQSAVMALTSFMRRWAVANSVPMAWWHYDYAGPFAAANSSGVVDDMLLIALGLVPANRATYDSATNAIISNCTVAPSARRKDLIYQLVKTLEDAGVWAKLVSLYVHAGHDPQAGLIDWKNPGTRGNDLTLHGGLTTPTDAGWYGNGTTGYLSSARALGSAMTPQDTAIGQYLSANVNNAGWGLGIAGETAGNAMLNSATDYFVALMDSSFNFAQAFSPTTDTYRVWRSQFFAMADRSTTGTIEVYANGTLNGSITASNAGHTASLGNVEEFRVFGTNYAPSTVKCCATVYANSMTAAQHAQLYAALDTYFREIGAVT